MKRDLCSVFTFIVDRDNQLTDLMMSLAMNRATNRDVLLFAEKNVWIAKEKKYSLNSIFFDKSFIEFFQYIARK